MLKNSYCIRLNLLYISSFFILLYSTTLRSENNFNEPTFESHIPTYFEAFVDTLFMDEFIPNEPIISSATRADLSPEEIILLIKLVNGLELLQEQFFLRTNILVMRDPLDLPLFGQFKRPLKKRSLRFTVQPFATKANKLNFTSTETDLASYLALQEDTILEKLRNSFAPIHDLSPDLYLDTDLIFGLFKNAAVEQRRVGGTFTLEKRTRHWYFKGELPFYYLERNLFLTDKELQALEDEFGARTPEEQEKFKKLHIISDKLGFGDFRFQAMHQIFKNTYATVDLGFYTTLPIGFAFGKGFRGSSFDRPSNLPTLDLDRLFDIINNPTPQNQLTAFSTLSNLGLEALDRLSANLLDMPLHNGRHIGLALALNSVSHLGKFLHRAWARHLHWYYGASLEYLLPAYERRFFINKVDTQGFESRDFDDAAQAADNLDFLTQQALKRFFLQAFTTKVSPGIILRSTSRLEYNKKRWTVHIGTDSWLKTADKLTDIQAAPAIINGLDIKKAKPPFAFQSAFFAGFMYRFEKPRTALELGVNGYATTFTRGIGHEYGISLILQSSF